MKRFLAFWTLVYLWSVETLYHVLVGLCWFHQGPSFSDGCLLLFSSVYIRCQDGLSAPTVKKYKWDSKILGQCLAKQERLENYIPPPDRKAVVIQQKGKLALDNRINRYQKKFVEGEYKDLQQQLVNYNASAEDYNRTRPDKNQEPFPCFELHQEIQERAKEAEKDQMDLLSEYNSIVRDYKPFVQKMKEAGEMIARIEQEITRHGGGVLREGQESGESLDRNEQEQLEKTRRDEVDDLVRQIEPFEMA